jgi:hypothetical protein
MQPRLPGAGLRGADLTMASMVLLYDVLSHFPCFVDAHRWENFLTTDIALQA